MKKNDAMFNLGSDPVGVSAAPDDEGAVFDLTNAEAPAFEAIPKGTYPAIIEELEYTTSQSSGNAMIKVVYMITEGEFAERKVYDFLMLAGDGAKFALPRLKQMLIRVCPEVDISSFNARRFAESGASINRPCQIKLKITTAKNGEYKGEKRNQVAEVLSAEGIGGSFLG